MTVCATCRRLLLFRRPSQLHPLCLPGRQLRFVSAATASVQDIQETTPRQEPSAPSKTPSKSTPAVAKPRRSKSEAKKAKAVENVEPPATSAPEGERQKHEPQRPTRPQVWRTLLDRQTLGQSSSVLVVRDAERKRQPQKNVQATHREQQASEADSIQKILSSVQKQEPDADEADVQRYISSLRPGAHAANDSSTPPSVPRVQFEETAKALTDGFNQTQLARYITAHTTSSTAKPSPSERQKRKERGFDVSRWVPDAGTQSTSTAQRHRGKKALVDNIMRSVWGVEVTEEVESTGSLKIQMDAKRLSLVLVEGEFCSLRNDHFTCLLIRGNLSPIHELSTTRGVSINVNAARGILTVSGNKHKCLEVVGDVERLFSQAYSIELDIRLLRPLLRAWRQTLNFDAIARKCSCHLEYRDLEKKVINSYTIFKNNVDSRS